MKRAEGFQIKFGKFIEKEELVRLRGGGVEVTTGYKCMQGETYIGCVNLVNCDRDLGEFYCHAAYGGTYTVEYSCNVLLSGCHQW